MNIVDEAEFKRYQMVQKSGVTNMFVISKVMELAELTKNQCLYIMNNYAELRNKYGELNE